MRKRILSILLLLSLCLSLLVGAAQLKEDLALAGQLVRLHVIAASDSKEDQREKLLVRDAVLQQLQNFQPENLDQAIDLLHTALPKLAETAQQALSDEKNVTVSLETETYPKRDYGTFSLPAGEYISLKVMIGEAEGQNWWCVVYPALCHAIDAGEFEETAAEAGLSQDQIRLVTGKDVIFRFKFLEILQKLKDFF